MLRDRNSFRGHTHSPERFFPPDDDFTYMSNVPFQSTLDRPALGPRSSAGLDTARGSVYASRPGFTFESAATSLADQKHFFSEDLLFRILCPDNKVESVMGESDGIIEMLREDVGVEVTVTDPLPGSAERIIIISSDEVLGQLFLSLAINFYPRSYSCDWMFFFSFFLLKPSRIQQEHLLFMMVFCCHSLSLSLSHG